MTSTHDFTATAPDGSEVALRDYAGKVLLIVNVASKCGLTPQYEGLESLYRADRDRGLEILGFPCNQFKEQEPGTDAEIQDFCHDHLRRYLPRVYEDRGQRARRRPALPVPADRGARRLRPRVRQVSTRSSPRSGPALTVPTR